MRLLSLCVFVIGFFSLHEFDYSVSQSWTAVGVSLLGMRYATRRRISLNKATRMQEFSHENTNKHRRGRGLHNGGRFCNASCCLRVARLFYTKSDSDGCVPSLPGIWNRRRFSGNPSRPPFFHGPDLMRANPIVQFSFGMQKKKQKRLTFPR